LADKIDGGKIKIFRHDTMRKISTQIKKIELNSVDIEYTLRINPRARHIRLAVYGSGDLVVTQPRFVKFEFVENFLQEKAQWILTQITRAKLNSANLAKPLTRRDYLNNREKARSLITERVEYLNQFYNFKYKQINIRDQKTRWGSCSRNGGLNFNFRLLYLEENVRDYVIVHELCHLKEFNHSEKFWKLVAQFVPNFRELRNELKKGQLI